MIKKYFSKYTGQQIDEAVAALIENNVRIEDLNQEVVDLINSKANEQDLAALQKEIEDNQIKVVEIPVGILQKAVNEENLTAEELTFFTSDYRIYKCAVPLEGAEELGLQMYFVTSVTTDNTVVLSSHLYNVIIDFTTGKVELEASVDLEVIDLKDRISNLGNRLDSLETEVSNTSSAALNAEYLAYENQTAIEELKVSIEDLAGSGESTPTPIPEGEWVDKIYFNHNLSVDEVKAICDQLTFRIGSTCEYIIMQTDIVKVAIQGDYNSNSPSQVSNYRIFVWRDTQYFEFDPYSGWQTGKNGDGSYEIEEDTITVGQNNDILINLVSITPFGGSKGRVGELETAVEELHNVVSEFEEVGLHIMTQNHVLCPYIVEDIVKLATNQVSMTHRKMTTEEINFFTELKGNSTSKIAIPVEGIMIYAEKIREIDSADLKTMNYMVLSGTESYAMSVILRSDGGEDLNNTIDIFKYTFAEKRDIDALETAIGDINSLLDQINGEVM